MPTSGTASGRDGDGLAHAVGARPEQDTGGEMGAEEEDAPRVDAALDHGGDGEDDGQHHEVLRSDGGERPQPSGAVLRTRPHPSPPVPLMSARRAAGDAVVDGPGEKGRSGAGGEDEAAHADRRPGPPPRQPGAQQAAGRRPPRSGPRC